MSVGALTAGAAAGGRRDGGSAGSVAGMALPPTRLLLDRVLPAPGKGPSEKARRDGPLPHEIVTA